MIKRTLGCVALFGWLIAASAPLQAHHSLADVYDVKKDTELSGAVTSVKFTNPHGFWHSRSRTRMARQPNG